MIKKFVEAWEMRKKNLEEYFKTTKQEEYSEYKDLVKLLFNIVINPVIDNGWGEAYRTDNIRVIDDGNYQGTLLFILHNDRYQPCVDEYVYTSVGYGSYSSCDILQSIQTWDLPDERQVKEYMDLCLHLLQNCNKFVERVF